MDHTKNRIKHKDNILLEEVDEEDLFCEMNE
jgi:hypothetical protein